MLTPQKLFARRVAKWILKNTVISTEHLTPELKLRLITPNCPLWMSRPENCPFEDPYWAFYWPGGQVLARFLLDQPQFVSKKSVWEIGCGCGSGAVVSAKSHAKSVLANDIDVAALVATYVNGKLNNTPETLQFSSENLLLKKFDTSELPDVILLGDMFHDSEMANKLLKWVKGMYEIIFTKPNLEVLIGDPGRSGITSSDTGEYKFDVLHSCALPPYITQEHYGCSVGKVIKLLIK